MIEGFKAAGRPLQASKYKPLNGNRLVLQNVGPERR